MKLHIERFVVCARCATDAASVETTVERIASLDVGIAPGGLQIWCRRHEVTVAWLTPRILEKWIAAMPHCETCWNQSTIEGGHA